MKLARVFQDNIVLQCRMPILIWESTDKEEEIIVKIYEQEAYRVAVVPGTVFLQIPPQEVTEDITLKIGDIILSHVGIGEVWGADG